MAASQIAYKSVRAAGRSSSESFNVTDNAENRGTRAHRRQRKHKFKDKDEFDDNQRQRQHP